MPVYLIHLEKPIAHSMHYVGWAKSLDTLPERIKHHKSGNGARFLQVANLAGINYAVVRVWKNCNRDFERFLKDKYKCNRKICPICNPKTAMRNLANLNDAFMKD